MTQNPSCRPLASTRSRDRQFAGLNTVALKSFRLWLPAAIALTAVVLLAAPWHPKLPSILESRLNSVGPKSLNAFIPAFVELIIAAGYRMALVALIGGVMASAFGRPKPGAWSQACCVAIATALPVLIHWPSSFGMLLAPLAVTLGLWSWWLMRLAASRPFWAGALIGVSLVSLVSVPLALASSLMEDAPAVVGATALTQEDRSRFEQMLKLASNQEGEHVELHLSPADLGGIAAAWAASRTAGTRLAFDQENGHLLCTLTHPIPADDEIRYLNVVAEVRPAISNGSFDLGIARFQVGCFHFPHAIVKQSSSAIVDVVRRRPDTARLLAAIKEMSFTNGKLHLVTDPDRASSAFAASMATSSEAGEQLRADAREIMLSLVAEAAALPKGDERFSGLLRKAFEIAARGPPAASAVERNRAALVALAIQIGDPRIRRFAGFPANEEMPAFLWDFDDHTTLRGRNDLARHFIVSAALRALATRDIGMTIGLFKEQLDAVDGGTGFSFTDISADMAGLRFADNVLAPVWAARMQQKVAKEASVESLMPSLENLSDGLSQVMFEKLYGSLNDERYKMVIRTIARRMEMCSLLTTRAPELGN